MRLVKPLMLLFTLLAVLLLVGCGGGGGGNNNPNPNPNPNPQKSPTPDGTTVVAIFDTQQMRFSMGSGVGAFEPGATVHVFDPNLDMITTTADGSGAINIVHEDVPPMFINAPGTVLTVTQIAPGNTESDPITTTIQLV